MAKYRKNISSKVKGDLRREAGEKCANPGCSAARTHVHHIRHWAVYQAHDQRHMIAICPNCHDAVHHGELKISDETIYRWKGIQREPSCRGHLYVEPRRNPTINLGTNDLFGPPDGSFAFNLSPRNQCSIRIVDDEILLLSLKITTLSSVEIFRFVENYWKKAKGALVRLHEVPGHIQVTTKAFSEFLPAWVAEGIRTLEPQYTLDEELLLLDIQVVEPGRVNVRGLWVDDDIALVATTDGLFIAGKNHKTGEPTAAGIRRCGIDLSKNGIISPTLFRVMWDDDTGNFNVRIGYS